MHKLILADDQAVFRTGAARIFAVEEDFRIIGQCDDTARLMKAVSGAIGATALFAASLDLDLAALVEAARPCGCLPIAILEKDQSPQEFLRAGIRGIVFRDVTSVELVRCVKAVAKGDTYVQKRSKVASASFESDLVAERVRERLTPKELQIVRLLLKGYKNRDIAKELHNSEQVIKNYLRSIFDKTGVSDRLELALFVMHHKILMQDAPPEKRTHTPDPLPNVPLPAPMDLLKQAHGQC